MSQFSKSTRQLLVLANSFEMEPTLGYVKLSYYFIRHLLILPDTFERLPSIVGHHDVYEVFNSVVLSVLRCRRHHITHTLKANVTKLSVDFIAFFCEICPEVSSPV